MWRSWKSSKPAACRSLAHRQSIQQLEPAVSCKFHCPKTFLRLYWVRVAMPYLTKLPIAPSLLLLLIAAQAQGQTITGRLFSILAHTRKNMDSHTLHFREQPVSHKLVYTNQWQRNDLQHPFQRDSSSSVASSKRQGWKILQHRPSNRWRLVFFRTIWPVCESNKLAHCKVSMYHTILYS